MVKDIEETIKDIYEYISWCDEVPKELMDKLVARLELDEKIINKATEILGEYRHYSAPDEEQNRENEDIVNKAYDLLKEERK